MCLACRVFFFFCLQRRDQRFLGRDDLRSERFVINAALRSCCLLSVSVRLLWLLTALRVCLRRSGSPEPGAAQPLSASTASTGSKYVRELSLAKLKDIIEEIYVSKVRATDWV